MFYGGPKSALVIPVLCKQLATLCDLLHIGYLFRIPTLAVTADITRLSKAQQTKLAVKHTLYR